MATKVGSALATLGTDVDVKYQEEKLARVLHVALKNRFPTLTPTIKGCGVHWTCNVESEDRKCKINCFYTPRENEFFATFYENSRRIAEARNASRRSTLDAVEAWLNGDDLQSLYNQFSFVDSTKRSLRNIQDQVLKLEPIIASDATSSIVEGPVGGIHLTFNAHDRRCEVRSYWNNELADAWFYWDRVALFHFQIDNIPVFARVLAGWLPERLMPSAMRAKFKWLDIHKLADYYEQGRPIEGEFITSWEFIEQFFEETLNATPALSQKVSKLIREIRAAGFDKVFRAGQSLIFLMVSRSRHHGLEEGQPYLVFRFHEDLRMTVYDRLDGNRSEIEFEFDSIELNDKVSALLQDLQERPID